MFGVKRQSVTRIIKFAGVAAAAAGLLVSATAMAQDKVSVRTDWFHSAYHSPFFLGIEKGFYADAGIELDVTEGRGSGQVVQLVGNGEDQFGFASVDSVFRGVSKGITVISVANIMPTMGQAVYVLKSSGITTPQQLKGKSIAITPGGTNEALLPAFLENIGLKENDLNYINVSPATKVRLFMSGEFDAIMATAWAKGLFEGVGGADTFVYSDYGVKMVGYNIVSNPKFLAANPDLARRFLAATLKSWKYAKAHPEESLDALAKNSKPNAKPARRQRNSGDFATALEFVGTAVEGKAYGFQSEKDWKDTQALLLRYDVIDGELDLGKLFTNDFVAESMTN